MTIEAERTAADAPGLVLRSAVPLNAETRADVLCRSQTTPTVDFFVRTHGDVPRLDAATFRLEVAGDVATPLRLSLADLRDRFPAVTVRATLACAGNRRSEVTPPPQGIGWEVGAIGTAGWTGVPLRAILLAAGADPAARHVAFLGADDIDGEGFGASIPLAKAMSAEVLVAYEMNGAPLTAEHGSPLRVVVPGWVGARSVKWLASVTVQEEPSTNFFQAEDYVIDGEQLSELPLTSAICTPGADGVVPAAPVRIEGYAMGRGGRGIERVEVSGDGGTTWQPAVLSSAGGEWMWRLWTADVVLPPGPTEIVVRAWDTSGNCQPERVSWAANPRGYLYNAWPRRRLVAAPRG